MHLLRCPVIDLRSVRSLAGAVLHEAARHLLPGGRTLIEDTTSCVIGSNEHAVHDGMLICRTHLEELGRLLHDIEDNAAILSAAPAYAMNYETKSSPGLASEQAPARLNVIAYTDPRTNLVPRTPADPARPKRQAKRFGPWCLMCDHQTCTDWRAGRHRDLHDDEQDAGSDRILSALGTLHSWADNVRDARRMSRPTRVTLTGERDLLTRQLRWIAEQYWVADFYEELKPLARELAAANGVADVPVGVCDTIRPDGEECGGQVWHVLIRPDGKIRKSGPPSPDDEPGFRCSTCRRITTGTEAVRQRDRMWRAEQARKTEKGKISS